MDNRPPIFLTATGLNNPQSLVLFSGGCITISNQLTKNKIIVDSIKNQTEKSREEMLERFLNSKRKLLNVICQKYGVSKDEDR
jgi:hypothetical protein